MLEIFEPGRNIPVIEDTDVLVAGGGIAGIAAALSASRNGARVTLVEKEYALGGMATLGLITIFLPLCDGMGHQVVYGIGEELLRLSITYGAEADYPCAWLDGKSAEERRHHRFKVRYNPHMFASLAEKLLRESGVNILYGSSVCAADVQDGLISHIIAENKSGRVAIKVKNVVDCSGDADVCKLSGEDTYTNPEGNGLANWYYYHTKGEVKLNMFGLADVVPDPKLRLTAPDEVERAASIGDMRFSGVDGVQLSHAVQLAHSKMLDDILSRRAKSPDLVPVTVSAIPLVRMSRRLRGRYELCETDMGKKLHDSVGMTGDWCRNGPTYEIPFSALVGNRIKNLITAGRIISTSDAVWNVTRVIPPSAVSGQAAGTAAAMFSSFDSCDVSALQERLVAQRVKLHMDQEMD